MDKKFYITTTIPYVNDDPHIGFALELIQADAVARLHILLGDDVLFNYGTDEHGLKILQKAKETGKGLQEYVDEYAPKFANLKQALNLSSTHFVRTSDPHHIQAAQEMWKRCKAAGDIYKKMYKIKYCVGCELEKTDSELTDGRCPLHPNRELEIIEEENYFFRFSKYQQLLLEFYEKNPDFVIPGEKYKEIKAFVKAGLEDFSVSRLKSKMPWGVEVPDDPEHVQYVWFDALTNYISTLEWPENQKIFSEYWPGVQTAGKDNLRQQTAMWQAMLMSAGLPNSKQIFIHGFLTRDGQKISKSLGTGIDPYELVSKYGTDAVRYYMLAKVRPFEDSDFTYQKFEEAYNADLANGLGNLIARTAKLCEKSDFEFPENKLDFDLVVKNFIEKFRTDEALKTIWSWIQKLNESISGDQPWTLEGKTLNEKLMNYVLEIRKIAFNLQPFIPETANKILLQFKGPKIKSGASLFPRL